MDSNTAIYSISSVGKITGLTQRQIRYYESIGLIDPQRSKGNQRIYSSNDTERLLLIKSLLDEGLTLQGIKAILESDEMMRLQGKNRTGPRQTTDEYQKGLLSNGSTSEEDNLRAQYRQGSPLSSIYPVNNQSALYRMIQDLIKKNHTSDD